MRDTGGQDAGGEESIYALLPVQQEVLPKPVMYRSKHPGSPQAAAAAARTRPAATMGKPLGQNADHPAVFLRSHAKSPVLPAPTSPSHPKQKVKPAVPSRDDKPLMGLATNKNYITSNAIEVILAAPGKVPQEETLYVQKKDFGKVPAYLQRNKAAIAQEAGMLEEFVRLRSGGPQQQQQQQYACAATPMSQDEREALLRHLKLKWAALNTEFQKLGFVMDIESKVKRREAMERQLAEVEGDIATLTRGDVVLVVPDDGRCHGGGGDC